MRELGSNFLILALPRSRTAWLSRFLSYGPFTCTHEELRHMRSLEDIKLWFQLPYNGSAETGAASWWRLVNEIAPETKIVVIRRAKADVLASFMGLDLQNEGFFDPQVLGKTLDHQDRKLDQIVARCKNVLEVSFEDLAQEAVCAKIFEYCLGIPHDRAWWSYWSKLNVQISMPMLIRYARVYDAPLKKLAAQATAHLKAEMHKKKVLLSDAVVIAPIDVASFKAQGQALFIEHSLSVDEAPEAWKNKNFELLEKLEANQCLEILAAKSNGKMFGYLVTIIGPTLEYANATSAIHTSFYASSAMQGLGQRLLRVSHERLRAQGVKEVYLRSGQRAMGPRTAVLYKRLGALPDGQLFKLELN